MIGKDHVPHTRCAPGPDGKTQKDKLLAGEPYSAFDPELTDDRIAVRKLLHQLNTRLEYDDVEGRQRVLKQLLASANWEDPPWIEPPFFCDYGYNISVGAGFYCNFNCVLLDCGRIDIGDRVLLGPAVQIYTVGHHIDPDERSGAEGLEMTKPVKIGNDVWLGGGCIILPGITIGDGATVAAGSIVTKDVEPYTVVAGNPARVKKRLKPGDDRGPPPAEH